MCSSDLLQISKKRIPCFSWSACRLPVIRLRHIEKVRNNRIKTELQEHRCSLLGQSCSNADREETALMTIEANFLVLPFHPRQCESFNVTRYFECRERLTLKPTVRV